MSGILNLVANFLDPEHNAKIAALQAETRAKADSDDDVWLAYVAGKHLKRISEEQNI